MKIRNLLSLLLVMAMMLGLLGCTNQPADQTDPSDNTQQQTNPSELVQPGTTEPSGEKPVEPVEVGVLFGDIYRFTSLSTDVNGANGVTYYATTDGKTLSAFETYQDGTWSDGKVSVTPLADETYHLGQVTTSAGSYAVMGFQVPETGAIELHTRMILDEAIAYNVQLAQGTPDNIIGSHETSSYAGTECRHIYSLAVTEGEMLYLLYKPQSEKDAGFRFANFALYTGVGAGAVPTNPINPINGTADAVTGDNKREIKFTDLVGQNNGMNGLTFYYTADGAKLNPLTSYDAAEGKWYKGGDGVLVYPCLVKKDNYGLFGSSVSEYIVMGYKVPATGNINLFTWVALQSGHDYQVKIAKGSPTNIIETYDVCGESQTIGYRNTTLDVKRGDVLYIHYKPLEVANGAWGGFNTSIIYNSGGEDYQVFDPNGFEAPENAVGTSIPFTTLVESGKNGANGLTFLYTEDGKTLVPFTDYVAEEGKWYHGADGTLIYPNNAPAENYGMVGSSSGEYPVLEYQINQKGTIDVYNWFALQSGHDYQVQVAKNSPQNILYVLDVKGESQTVKDRTVTLNVNKGDKLYILYKPLEADNGAWGGYKAQITWVAVNEHTGPKDPTPIVPDKVEQPTPVVQPDLNDGVTKILAIGNSFTVDTMEYVKKITASAGVNNVQLGKLVIGGANLNNHANNAQKNAPNYEYGFGTADGGWYTVYNQTMAAALMDENWDYVIIQQNSSYSGQASGFTKLDELLTYIKTYTHADTRLVYNMTWAYQQNSNHVEFPWYDKDQTKMYEAIVSTTQSAVMVNNKLDLLLPTGTAVQNARTSYVGDTLTLDGYHMSRDQGRYVVAMALAKAVLGIDLSNVTYTPAGVSETFRQMAAEAANNAAAAPYAVTASTFTTAPQDEVRRETLNFADMASTVNGSNGLTFYYTTDGKTLVPYTLYDANMGRWYDNSDNQLNLFDPAEVKADNFGLGQCSATKYVAMGYTAQETGSLDLFSLTVIQGPEGTYGYNVRIAKGTADNTVYEYTFSGVPGVSQEERYTLDVNKGDEIFLIYELTEGKTLGGWFGYRNTITYRTAEADSGNEPEYSVKVGDTFKATELMPTGINGEKGMFVYHTADGVTLNEFSGYAPTVHNGRWFYSLNDVNGAFIDPFVAVADNYGWAGASNAAYAVMGYKMPEAGKISLTNWLATHTGHTCELMIAQSTPDNVVKTYTLDAPNGWQESYELEVQKGQMVYIHYKPVNAPVTADTCYFGYKSEYTYLELGSSEPEYSVKVGDTFTAVNLMPTAANGEKGMYVYQTSDGVNMGDFMGFDPINHFGRWYYMPTGTNLTFIDPFVDTAANYGWVGASTSAYGVMAYKMPEAGTISLTNWLATHTGHTCELMIAQGTPDNVVKTYSVNAPNGWQESCELTVQKDQMVYIHYKPVNGSATADTCYFGYKCEYTYLEVGSKEPEYSVKVGDTFTAVNLMPTTANGEKGMYVYQTADGINLGEFTGYDPNNHLGRWYYMPTGTNLTFIDPFVDTAANYGWVGASSSAYTVMAYKMPEVGTIELTNWLATHTGHTCELMIAQGTLDNVVKSYSVDAPDGWQESCELTVAKDEMIYVIFKPVNAPVTADTCYYGYRTQYTYTAVG